MGLDYCNNRLNPKMNNLMSIDFAIRDWIDDTDLILPRATEEFPRLANEYTQKRSVNKPWGDKSDPIYIEPFLDENQLKLSDGPNYQKGVWYYSDYPLTDHHDMAGLPNIWRGIQTMIGLEYRPTFWINVYNRIRLLDFGKDNLFKHESEQVEDDEEDDLEINFNDIKNDLQYTLEKQTNEIIRRVNSGALALEA